MLNLLQWSDRKLRILIQESRTDKCDYRQGHTQEYGFLFLEISFYLEKNNKLKFTLWRKIMKTYKEIPKMKKTLCLAFAALAFSLGAISPASAVTNGQPDGDKHQYVGLLVFDDARATLPGVAAVLLSHPK